MTSKAHIISELQNKILHLQGLSTVNSPRLDLGLGPIKDCFPNASFPLGCVHEFLSEQPEGGAATGGFITSLLTSLVGAGGSLLWASASRKIFPPALKSFGISPDRIIFVDLQKEKDVVWTMEEALKCPALTAVIGEVRNIDFTASRRLQLAVEQSKVTGFIIRNNKNKPGTTACVSRWRIMPLPGVIIDELPGIGFPKWRVELLRMRNGKPGAWDVYWENRLRFENAALADNTDERQRMLKVG